MAKRTIVSKEGSFCRNCGASLQSRLQQDIPPAVHVCPVCNYVDYNNPIPVVLCVLHTDTRVLMIKRATPPYTDRWAPPGGYVDSQETIDAAIVREVREETGIEVDADRLIPYSIISLPRINQVCIVCRCRLEEEQETVVGPEARDARWFSKEQMPFDEYYLPGHVDGLKTFYDSMRSEEFRVFMAEASYAEGHNRSIEVLEHRNGQS